VDEVERRLQFSVLDEPLTTQTARKLKKKQKPPAKPEPAHTSPSEKRSKLRRQPKGKHRRR
jgi:hypothetical protein